jgi:hypothetical protein
MGVLSETCTFFKSYLGEETLLQEQGLFLKKYIALFSVSNALSSAVDLNVNRFF